MAGWQISLDPTSEDASNTQLDLVTTAGTASWLLDHQHPPPELNAQSATSVDTEGSVPVDLQYRNRKVTDKLRFVGTSAADLETRLSALFQKLGKFQREGGTYKLTSPAGTVIVFDVLPESQGSISFDRRYMLHNRAEVDVELTCKPFWRSGLANEITLSDHVETTLPCLIFTEATIKGDVPGLPRLVVDNDQAGQDQWFLHWGQQSRYYSSSANAALFYEAEGRTAMGGSATAAGPSGASGSGSNVMRNTTLTTTPVAILSTQASGGGAHLSHVGDFEVWARVQVPTSNTGTVSIALDWAEGDFRSHTINDFVSLAFRAGDAANGGGVWRLINLGQVHLSKVPQGTQRWEGRILAKSTIAGDDIDIDYLYLVPTTEGSGQAIAVQQFEQPTAFTARDEFDQSAGNLAGKTLPVGGTWSGSGDATGFSVETVGHSATRAVVNGTPHFAQAGTTSSAAILVQADVASNSWNSGTSGASTGVFCRYVDANNYFWVLVQANDLVTSGGPRLSIAKIVGGSQTVLGYLRLGQLLTAPYYYTVRVLVDASGRWFVWFFPKGFGSDLIAFGADSVFATGGALATGKFGIVDSGGNQSDTRNVDNFFASVPIADAAVFASQSLELRSDRVIREDSGGTLWPKVSKYEGSYLKVPPSGQEARTLRMIVKTSRNDPATMPDSGIDDVSAKLFYQHRGLVAPEA